MFIIFFTNSKRKQVDRKAKPEKLYPNILRRRNDFKSFSKDSFQSIVFGRSSPFPLQMRSTTTVSTTPAATPISETLSKALSAKSSWPDKEEFLDVVYWLRQVL